MRPEPLAAEDGPADAGSARQFEQFVVDAKPHLLRTFAARYGSDKAPDLTADVLAYGWEEWDRLSTMANPIGYLVRVGQSRSRRYIRWETAVHLPVESYSPAVPDVGLHTSLAQLRPDRRAALLLVYSYHYSYAETAELLGIRVSTVRNHLQRGLRQLRRDMKDETDADDS